MKNSSELNKEWMVNYMRNVMNQVGDGSSYRSKEVKCWSMYNSKSDNETYSYLVKYGDWDIPVNLRFTSIVRPNLDYLTSRYIGNPFNFSVMTVDKKSLEKKYMEKINKYLDTMEDVSYEKYLAISDSIQQINNKKQELEYMLQQQPENEEMAAQMEQIRQQMPLIMMKMAQMTQQMNRELERESKKLDTIKVLGKIKAEDIREDFAHKKLRSMFEEDGILNENKLAFVDKLVTGRPAIYVNIEDGKLIYRQQPSMSFYHPRSTSVRYAEELDWQAIDEFYPVDYVLSRWGSVMTDKEIDTIRAYSGYTGDVYENGSSSGFNYVENSGGSYNQSGIRVTRIYWQYVAKNRYKVSPSKGDIPHVNKYREGDKLKDNDKIETRYKSYTFQGVVINSNIYVDVKPMDHQILKVDDWGWNQLPVVADSYDDVSRSPYSLIWATRDLQALNTIIEYYKELLLVISGVKGFVMDESQLPSGMGKKEWMYFRKLGVMWIETYKKDRRIQPNFNQFQQYDDTISGGIQYLMAMQDRIQSQVDQITGVARQARGDMESRDLVGTSQLAIQATSIIADVLFWEHDQVIRRALTRALNLYCKHIGNNGDIFNIIESQLQRYETVKIPEGLLDGADYDAKVMNNNKDFRDMETMRQAIMNEYSRGNINISGLTELMDTKTLQEMKLLAVSMVEKAESMRQQQQEGQKQVQMEIIKFEKELDAQIQAPMQQLKQLELQLTKLDLDLKDKQIIFEDEFSKKQLDSQNFLKALEIMTEREVELKYLDEQKQARQVDNILEQARMIADTLLGKQTNDIKDKELTMRPKEKIKDSGHTLKK